MRAKVNCGYSGQVDFVLVCEEFASCFSCFLSLICGGLRDGADALRLHKQNARPRGPGFALIELLGMRLELDAQAATNDVALGVLIDAQAARRPTPGLAGDKRGASKVEVKIFGAEYPRS